LCLTGHAEHIEISFYTNITNMQDKWLEQLGKFEKAIVNCSLEGMGAMNDYLRPPSNFCQTLSHFEGGRK
jgi:sulfatase maturation enzyme AslB (radical SAM superfamily)